MALESPLDGAGSCSMGFSLMFRYFRIDLTNVLYRSSIVRALERGPTTTPRTTTAREGGTEREKGEKRKEKSPKSIRDLC